jgi:hypothetical protein
VLLGAVIACVGMFFFDWSWSHSLYIAALVFLGLWFFSEVEHIVSTVVSAYRANLFRPYRVKINVRWYEFFRELGLVHNEEEWLALIKKICAKSSGEFDYRPVRDGISFVILKPDTSLIYSEDRRTFCSNLSFFREMYFVDDDFYFPGFSVDVGVNGKELVLNLRLDIPGKPLESVAAVLPFAELEEYREDERRYEKRWDDAILKRNTLLEKYGWKRKDDKPNDTGYAEHKSFTVEHRKI